MIKYLSLFSGIGAFEKSLWRLQIPYELVGYCEIDKYASKAYSLLHKVPESMNFGDITQLDETTLPDDIDLITYGFPCQDISLAGHQKGLLNDDGSKTRSGLFFDALRIIEHTQPKVAIAENVKNLTGTKFSEQFNIVLQSLADAGYNNYWKVLNAKDYEVPQNRERVIIVSIRKDIDTGIFEFPEPVELKLRLKDLLEDTVDEKYYVNPERVKALTPQLVEKQISNAIRGGNLEPFILIGSTQKNAFVGDGNVCCTLTEAMGKGGGQIPMVGEIINPLKGVSGYGWHFEQNVYDAEGIIRALKAGGGSGNIPKVIEPDTYRVRKLTPKECFRLMGFDDADIDVLIENGISNTQLYKMAGNSIVVNMLEFLFCQIFDNDNEIWV